MMRRQNRQSEGGFTLIELMLVVSLIALLLGVSVPLVFKIDELSRDRSGINTFGVAVTAARAYATRQIADTEQGDGYSGAAILVTPMNQLRLVSDVQDTAIPNLYRDIPRTEVISMPRGMGVAGIVRTAAGSAGLSLLPPPYAIRFDRHGHLISEADISATGDPSRLVVYDDGSNAAQNTRPGGYSPNAYDPDLSDISSKWNENINKYTLPFYKVETVIGVVVYSKADFEDAGGAWPTTAPAIGCTGGCGSGATGIQKWMFENGSVLFFSRNTGAVIRTNAP